MKLQGECELVTRLSASANLEVGSESPWPRGRLIDRRFVAPDEPHRSRLHTHIDSEHPVLPLEEPKQLSEVVSIGDEVEAGKVKGGGECTDDLRQRGQGGAYVLESVGVFVDVGREGIKSALDGEFLC